MSTNLITLIGLILGCCLVIVLVDASKEQREIAELNRFLVNAARGRLAPSLEKAIAKDRSGYGFQESKLVTPMKNFLTVASAKNCTFELVDAMGYLLNDGEMRHRVNKMLKQDFWTEERRKECVDSLRDLARQFISNLPNDPEMRTYVRHVGHSQHTKTFDPLSPNFFHVYRRNPAIVNEMIGIIEEKAIALVGPEGIEDPNYTKRCKDLIETYYTRPCEKHLELSSNFVRFVEFLRIEENLDSLPVQVWNITYRQEACKAHKELMALVVDYGTNICRKILKLYTETHSARE